MATAPEPAETEDITTYNGWAVGDDCPNCGSESFLLNEKIATKVGFAEEGINHLGDVVYSEGQETRCASCGLIVADGITQELVAPSSVP